jgi:hypothetical protein
MPPRAPRCEIIAVPRARTHAGKSCRYWLKLEAIAEWFPCFTNGLKLLPYVETGWLDRGMSTPCWWKPADMTCKDYYSRAKLDNGTLVPINLADGADHTVKHDRHDTGAAERWQEMYDQKMADIVHELYKPDFALFGYEQLKLTAAGSPTPAATNTVAAKSV